MMQSFEQQSKTEKEEGVKSMKRLNKFKRKVKRISSLKEKEKKKQDITWKPQMKEFLKRFL